MLCWPGGPPRPPPTLRPRRRRGCRTASAGSTQRSVMVYRSRGPINRWANVPSAIPCSTRTGTHRQGAGRHRITLGLSVALSTRRARRLRWSTPPGESLVMGGEQVRHDPERDRLCVDLPPVVVAPRAGRVDQLLALDASEPGAPNVGRMTAGHRDSCGRQMGHARRSHVDGSPRHPSPLDRRTRKIRTTTELTDETALNGDSGRRRAQTAAGPLPRSRPRT